MTHNSDEPTPREERFNELADRLEKEDAEKYALVIQRCRDNSYHDFMNPDDIPVPKMQMVADLEAVGLFDDAKQVREGYYDQ